MVRSKVSWFFFLSCFVFNAYTFEVKVLLQKFQKSDLASCPLILASKHGFVVSNHASLSLGKEHASKQLTITCNKDNNLVVSDTILQDICYIRPLLSDSQQQITHTMVQDYFVQNQKNLLDQGEMLSSFFDHFIAKKSEVSATAYQLLQQYTERVIDQFLCDITKQIDDLDSVITYEKLLQQAVAFINSKIKYEFLQQLASYRLSKKDRKLLQQDPVYRYKFFMKVVHVVIAKLLQGFLIALPRTVFALLSEQEAECLTYDGYQYRGTFALLCEGDIVYLINSLDIDDYLLSVVRHEGWPGWPLEVNKVFAVACRTYLVWQVLQSQKTKRPYHIANDIRHQTYKGHHKYARLKKAIDDTKDICIAFNGKPILAMFDACCGGIVPGDIDQPADFNKHTYLLRDKACAWCKGCKVASWNIEVSYEEMLQALQKEIPVISEVDSMVIVERDKAGLPKKVRITCQDNAYLLPGKKIYSMFPGVKSFCFDIIELPRKKIKNRKKQHYPMEQYEGIKRFMITGKGYGHHVGLCQWGAMKLVKEHHWNYQKILKFYYPGTSLIKLQYKR